MMLAAVFACAQSDTRSLTPLLEDAVFPPDVAAFQVRQYLVNHVAPAARRHQR